MIMIGVASTAGSPASLNWLARCSGPTTRVKLPVAPTGMGCIARLPSPARRLQLGLALEGTRRHVAEKRQVRVLRHPVLLRCAPGEDDGGSAGAVVGRAVLAIARRLEDRNAD